MSSLRLLLGLIPSTSKIEQAAKALTDEYEKMKSFAGSELLDKYTRLKDLVNSSAFIQKKKEIESLKFKNSEEFSREKEFMSMQKAKDIVMYFKTIPGNMLKRFKELDGSAKIRDFEDLENFIKSNTFRQRQKMKPITFKDTDEYRKFIEYKSLRKDPEIKAFRKAKQEMPRSKAVERFEELEKFINSSEFLAKKNMRPITFKDSEEYKKLMEYKRLKESPDISDYYKFKASREYANFLNIDGSERLKRYNELKDYLATPEFRDRKNYLLDTKRFEKTQEFKDLQEYQKLQKNEDIVWYFKVKDSNKFDELKKYDLTFADDFNSDSLDAGKWITNFYWGDKLLKDNYSVGNDLHAYTPENVEVRNSLLTIHTKPQKVNGKVWSPTTCFRTKEFGFTSGIVTTGKSVRQKYGVFSAKIKLGNPAARNNFWMLSERITPHIVICRTSNNKVWTDFVADPGRFSKSSIGPKYANDFFIYTLEWTSDSLTWKINGQEIARQTSNVPQEPMYVLLAGGVEKPVSGMTTMEVDWVKIYQFK